jgi:hypothetical protein
MYSRLLAVLAVLVLTAGLCSEHSFANPDTLWTQTYCGGADDGAYSVYQTSDGGFIMTGAIGSCDLKQVVSLGGDADVWLVKTDANGDTLWKKTYGGPEWERGNSVQQTSDGGYIIAGGTYSFGAGDCDVWLIKTDANGDTLWTRTYGGSGWDGGYSVRQTSDGGYVIAGWESSFGGGGADVWLLRTDANGDTLWTNTFGTDEGDWGKSVQETVDSGFVVVGNTWGIVGSQSHVYLIKTDQLGNQDWAKTYAGGGISYGSSIQLAPDSGYIISGATTVGSAGGYDIYLLKTDSLGNYDWSKTYGGTGDDASDGFSSVQPTSDDGYVVVGWTESFGAGGSDLWLLKTDANGDTAWTAILGGSGDDEGWSVVQDTSDDGYMVAGFTNSFGAGDFDLWLLKMETPTAVEDEVDGGRPLGFALYQNYPNPFNPVTTLRYVLPRSGYVTLKVYNLLGQEVETIVSARQAVGEHTVKWDAAGFSTGIYFYRLQAGELSETKKLVLLK